MPRCEHCGAECAIPFTCQHCGGKFCPECRLPPAHDCTGMQSWKNRPAPGVGMKYGKGGGVTATGGGVTVVKRGTGGKPVQGIPWMKVMLAVIVLVILGLAYLVLSGAAGR
jgi:hypothetical protein